jgi:RNA polymerase sigma factor (sigma-70 family)
MQNSSDQELIAAIKNGNTKEALSLLYKEVLPLVINYVHRNGGNQEEAKDLFQDAILIFYKRLKKNEMEEEVKNVTGFIFHICKNLWINRVKKKSRFQFLIESKDYDAGKNFLDELMSEERKSAVLRCFSELGEDCKQLLKLSVFDKLSMNEISKRLGYSNENVAKTYNYRCKQKLLQIVKKYKDVVSLVRE